MKLCCSKTLQDRLDRICIRNPYPPDPLEDWYANVITLEGKDAIVVYLPTFRVCAFLMDVQEFKWADLKHQLVQVIRETLDAPSHAISRDIIDAYIPEDTELELYAPANQSATSRLTALSRQIQKSNALQEPHEILHHINHDFHIQDEIGVPFLILAKALRRKYEAPVQALKLKVSLNLGVYDARRAFLVSEDTTFLDLHHYLQKAYRWQDTSTHSFLIPASRAHPLLVRILDEDTEVPPSNPEEKVVLDRDARLADYIRRGDTFRYTYHAADQWQVAIRFTQYEPYAAVDLPVCTLLDGKSPPEGVGGAESYRTFFQIITNSKDPRYQLAMTWAGERWTLKESAESITIELRNSFELEDDGEEDEEDESEDT